MSQSSEHYTVDIQVFKSFWYTTQGQDGFESAKERVKVKLEKAGFDPSDKKLVSTVVHTFPKRNFAVFMAVVVPYAN